MIESNFYRNLLYRFTPTRFLLNKSLERENNKPPRNILVLVFSNRNMLQRHCNMIWLHKVNFLLKYLLWSYRWYKGGALFEPEILRQ